MEVQLPFSTKVCVVEEAVGRGRGREGGRHVLVIAVRPGNRRVAMLAVGGKKQPSNRPIKHVTNVIARTFPDARRYYHTTNAAQTSQMWTHNRYSLTTICTDASTTTLPTHHSHMPVVTHARNSKDFTTVSL